VVKAEEILPEEPKPFDQEFIFEQDPVQVLNALLPLYLNGQVLRMMQESVASELAARMTAMQSASTNAKSLVLSLSQIYNRYVARRTNEQILTVACL
jgi:F-type H+-transporting ATPase subunit gamma